MMYSKYKSGDQIGKLQLLSFKDNKWTVLCLSCNQIWSTRTHRLQGRENCPDCTPVIKFKHYKVGDIINGNTLLERLPSKKWRIRCHCGEIKIGSPGDLKKYKTCKACNRPEEDGIAKRLPGNVALYRRRLAFYIRGAKERDLAWQLSEEQFIDIIESSCHYCGERGSMKDIKKDRTISINGIDRVDNTKGYTVENIVPCCNFCNHAKKDYSYDYFINKIKFIAEYLSSTTIPSGSTAKWLET